MNKKLHTAKYLITDFLSASSAWTLFFIFRKLFVEPQRFGYKIPVEFDNNFYTALILIPVFWLLFYYITGYYKNVYRKSRLKEIGSTLVITIMGGVVIFFVLILDDWVVSYKNYYYSFAVLIGLHFFLTYIPRLIITTRTTHKIQDRIIGFNTIIVGSNIKAVELFKEINGKEKSAGNYFVGFVSVHKKAKYLLGNYIENLGNIDTLPDIIRKYKIEEIIIAIESNEHNEIGRIINKLESFDIVVKVIPDMYDILTGKVRMSSLYGVALIQISHDLMAAWEENLKRVLDILISVIALILLTPFYIFLSISVKLSSKGPILYSHERIGRYGKPFIIYKFRSMYIGAEKAGPALSSRNDSRITNFGLFMRKSRFDEIPQFYNVLIGDMSLVGPRPERQYFIDRIVPKAPHYTHLQKVRPGITSWGQVKYGYAENVDQMIERLKYDIIYIENMSLYTDLKILIYTVHTVIRGKGT
ncbi:MAG: sugar transferase [Bacteroidota bacterium]|nr:sugar transferase [Bacteroidota bacterium]